MLTGFLYILSGWILRSAFVKHNNPYSHISGIVLAFIAVILIIIAANS